MTTRTKAVFGIAGVFLLGGICGALILGLIVRDRVREARNLREREGFARFFFDRLQLSDSQNDSLREVVDSAYRQLEQLRQESSQRYVAVIDTLRSRVYPKLTSEQKVLFEEQEQRMRAMVSPVVRSPKILSRGMPQTPPVSTPPPHEIASAAPPTSTQPLTPAPSTQQKTNEAPPRQPLHGRDTTPVQVTPSGALQPRDIRRIDRLMQILTDRLALTDEQRPQVRAILVDQAQQMRQLDAGNVSVEDEGMERKQIRRQGFFRIVGLLTPDQRQTLRELRRSGQLKPGELDQ